MAPICARNCATRSCCCCATLPVAARASSRGKSPSTSAPAPIAAIICNHSRRVLLVTLRLTVHLLSRVAVQYVPGGVEGKVHLRQDQALVLEHWSSPPVALSGALVLTPVPLSRALVLTPCPSLPRAGPHPLSPSPFGRGGTMRDLRAPCSAALSGGRV